MKKYFISYTYTHTLVHSRDFSNDIIDWKDIDTKEDVKELEQHLRKERDVGRVTLLCYSLL
jgi:hypothetical protein